MNIGIDIRKLGHLGIGTYVYNLLRALERLPDHHRYVLFGHPDTKKLFSSDSRFSIVPNPTKQYSFGGMVSLARQADAAHLDVFHTPHYVLPLKMKASTVVTINDIIPLLFPEFFGVHKRAYAWMMMRRSCRMADRIIAISERTAADLKEKFGVPDDRLRVIPLGVGGSFRPLDDAEKAEIRARYSLPDVYCLYSGAFKPHKNVARLIAALARIPEPRRPVMVLIGDDLRSSPETAAAIERHAMASSIRILGKIQADDVSKIYGAAYALIHPSLYEGFGLTVLEAMASGIPVASSGCGSLTEVVGGAALMFDPLNEEEIAFSIERIVGDSALREDLIRKGTERVRHFTWERCAKTTLQVYREAAC